VNALSCAVLASAFSLAPVAGSLSQAAERPDPSKPSAATPAVRYQSVFSDYRPYQEVQIRPWRQSNDEVAAGQGHAGHGAKGGNRTPAPSPAAEPSVRKPAPPAASGGHETHGR
jgi:hypothetical protein